MGSTLENWIDPSKADYKDRVKSIFEKFEKDFKKAEEYAIKNKTSFSLSTEVYLQKVVPFKEEKKEEVVIHEIKEETKVAKKRGRKKKSEVKE